MSDNLFIFGKSGEGKDKLIQLLTECFSYHIGDVKHISWNRTKDESTIHCYGKMLYIAEEDKTKKFYGSINDGSIKAIYIGHSNPEEKDFDVTIKTEDGVNRDEMSKLIVEHLSEYITIETWIDLMKGRDR